MVGEAIFERLPDNWKRLVTVRVAIALALLVALLSVVTGVLNISQEAADFGPLAGSVPDSVQQAVGFTGALTGFLMVASALALRRGLRAGWWATLILLPVTAIQGLLQLNRYSLPLIALSLLSIPFLLFTRNRFDQELSLSTTQLAAGGALVGVQAYGTFGAYALREDFDGIENVLDAFYFTLITSSTVATAISARRVQRQSCSRCPSWSSAWRVSVSPSGRSSAPRFRHALRRHSEK